MRVFLVGPPGSGKSTVGKHLATHLNARFFDLDEVIKERAGADIPWILMSKAKVVFAIARKRLLPILRFMMTS